MLDSANALKATAGFTGTWPGAAKPKIAVGSTGAATVVWQEEGPDVNQIYAARISSSAVVGVKRLLTAASFESIDPAISCGNDGSAIISWTRFASDLVGPPTNSFVRFSTRGGFSSFIGMNSGTDETAGITSNASAPNGRSIIVSQLEGPSGSGLTAWSDL